MAPSDRSAFDAIGQFADATGVGLYVSSGDDGDEAVIDGAKAADFPATSPYVTAVGGTALGIDAAGQYLFEEYWGTDRSDLTADATSWNPAPGDPNSFVSGGGGGTSAIEPQPSWQAGTADAFATHYPAPNAARHRVTPDISALADPQTGYIVGQTQTAADGTVVYDEARAGGTSLSSPVIAAIMAIADQQRAAQGKARLGFASPALYGIHRSTPLAFHDVTDNAGPVRAVVRVDYVNGENASGGLTTSLRTIGDEQSLTSGVGYDDSTGLGTPNGQAFLGALAALP